MKRPYIAATEEHLEVLKSMARTLGSAETRERSLALLDSKSGFEKWYRRHYGFPFDPRLVVSRKALRHGAETFIAKSAHAAGIASEPVLLCSLNGLAETSLAQALSELREAPPLMLCAMPFAPSNFLLFWNEFNDFTFSSSLWSRLRIPEACWS